MSISKVLHLRLQDKTLQRLEFLEKLFSLKKTDLIALAVDEMYIEKNPNFLSLQDEISIEKALEDKVNKKTTVVKSKKDLLDHLSKLQKDL